VIPPPGWTARKEGYNNLDFVVKSKTLHQFVHYIIEPIEQNVNGTKGVYELVYFLKDSRTIERFKKSALETEKFILNKSKEDIEKLVRNFFQIFVVLAHPQA
jgi:hypothetical protein